MSESITSVWPETLPVFKLERQPKVAPRSESVQMESGRLRNRRKQLVPMETIDVSWTLVYDQFEAFEEYVHTVLDNGALPFQLATYTLTDTPDVLTEVTRMYAFLDSQYLFSRRDNEFEVTATMIIVSPESETTRTVSTRVLQDPEGGRVPREFLLTPSSCGETLTFTWRADAGVTSYLLESSDDLVTWTTFKSDIAGAASHITLSNPFDIARYWRLTASTIDGGTGTTANTHALAPEVALCNIALTGCTLLPSGAVRAPYRRIQINPVSVYENEYVALDNTYLWITARYDYFIADIQAGGPATTIDVTCATPGAIICWASDGSDPTLAGPNLQLLPSDDFFGCIIKARAWLNGCYGPVTTILIDKRVDLLPQCGTLGISGAAAVSGSASHINYVPVPDGVGGTVCVRTQYELGDSFVNGAADAAIANARAMFYDYIHNHGALTGSTTKQILGGTYNLTGGSNGIGGQTVDGGEGPACYADYQAGSITEDAATFQASLVIFTRLGFWDAQQSDSSQVRAYVVGAYETYQQVIGFSGPGGTGGKILTWLQTDLLIQQAAICQNPTPIACFKFSGNFILESNQVLLTRDKDSALRQAELGEDSSASIYQALGFVPPYP